LPELVPIKLGVVVLGRHDRGVEPDHVWWVVREERRDEGVGIHRPGFGDLLAAREEPLVGGNVVRELEAAGAEEHARPDDRVVELVVLADEVVLSDRLPSVPVRLPRVRTSGADCPLLRSGEIPRDGVEPDVETLRVVPVERYGHSPVEVAGDGRRVEALLEEVLRDAEGSRTPMLLMAQVLPELLLEPVELEIEVLRGPEFGRGAAKSTPRAPELTRLEGATAVVAFVTASVLEAAVRARADQVPVGKEPAVLRTVRPLGRPASDECRLEEPEEQFLDGLLVHDGVRVRVEVERETESLESVLVDRVVLFRDRKGSGLFLLGSDERRGAVHVGPRDHEDLVAAQPMEPGEDVSRKVGAGQVADMKRAVGVWPRDPDKNPCHSGPRGVPESASDLSVSRDSRNGPSRPRARPVHWLYSTRPSLAT